MASMTLMKRFNPLVLILGLVIMRTDLAEPRAPQEGQPPDEKNFTNSLGMEMIHVRAGSFRMGTPKKNLPREIALGKRHFREGDFDERPVHQVSISESFHMSSTEVTNEQYERYDPSHRSLRGKLGFSNGDDEAVVFVSWKDAVAFTNWLSAQEGLPYRLPTEAEWEYSCRAGTETHFHTGDSLPEAFHKNVGQSGFPALPREDETPSDLTVGKTPPNPWGLFDMHGNVEEWCYDWYGPFELTDQIDPMGRSGGDFKVTRGGSHSTELYYLRSANRSGALPQDKSWMIGFRVVVGEVPSGSPLPPTPPVRAQQKIRQEVVEVQPAPSEPYFSGPRRYVKIQPDSYGPMFSTHNHDPAIVNCPNGDLLAIWYTCAEERGREVGLLSSRLRRGEEEWEEASLFWDTPDRNDHTPAFWYDGEQTIYHFVGISSAASWGNLAIALRTSVDNGASWTPARLIAPEHGPRHMPEESVFRMQDGTIVLATDAIDSEGRGTNIWLSEDGGNTWKDPGGTIPGIHAAVAEISGGRLLAFSREHSVGGMMPKCISSNRGKSWKVTKSPFPPIFGGQRMVLLRLREGPLFFASFAEELEIVDSTGQKRMVSGLFGSISNDDGKTWPVRRLITDDGPGRQLNGGAWTGRFTLSHSTAEPKGYLSVCQSSDGVIHLISSALHYSFNLAWLQEPAPPVLLASRD